MTAVAGWAKASTKSALRRAGLDLRRLPDPMAAARRDRLVFMDRAEPMIERQNAQTVDDICALKAQYASPIFGTVRVYDLMERLALCIDSMDPKMGCVSQLTHSLQVVEGMRNDGIDDADMLIAGLIHDIGKLLLLVGEDPANVGGRIRPVGEYEEGVGFDHCVMQWGHDEFAYSRFKDLVPDHVAWLIRYHSLHFDECVPLMDERDVHYASEYGRVLVHYDGRTKSMFREPETRLTDYRDLLDEAFPDPILF